MYYSNRVFYGWLVTYEKKGNKKYQEFITSSYYKTRNLKIASNIPSWYLGPDQNVKSVWLHNYYFL